MEISTKFGIRDEVWFMRDNKAVRSKVSIIYTTSFDSTTKVYYIVSDDNLKQILEDKVFATKQELLESL